ncbi:MAG: N-acetyltransferase [Novosphingobium sp.]|nr:N-acetyltransferase [Novosphingobium sp.]
MEGTVITRHDQGARGEYHAAVPGSEAIGRLTYQRRRSADGGDVLVADHTLVPPEIGGRGVAARLVEALVADAREEGNRIVPQCSYVEAMFRRHPQWADLRA